ncbi:tetratricopeptide repeat protein [Hippea alviniae]|uniref:tetratricopeptide repeat protein n=1 Tax=Hippea alviniae TaxID=1279027 RepID=UPI0003B56CA4|nr:tetratricopeptide repeat protein [Hippea alviniae]
MSKFSKLILILIAAIILSSCASTPKRELTKDKAVQIALIKYEMARNIILHKDYKNLAEAFGYLEDAKKILKNDPKVYYMLAIAYQMRKNMRKYEEYLKKTIKIDPNFFDAYNALGIYYYQVKKYNKAIEMFTKLIENPLYSGADVAFYNRALVYLSLGKIKQAEEDLQDAVIFSGYSNPLYIKTLINVQIANKEYLKALKTISDMENNMGRSCFTQIKRAFCLFKLNEKQQALSVLNDIKGSSDKCIEQKNALLKEIENDINANN